jgi:hypothetical protein
MLQATYIRQYRKQGSTKTTFVYKVESSSAEELASFETAQGSYHRVDPKTGTPVWFTTRFVGETAELIITDNNKVIADMSEFEKARSLSEQYGGNFGDMLANKLANKLVAPAPSPKQDSKPEDISSL